MRHNSNALFRTTVEPLQKSHCASTAILVALAVVAIVTVLVAGNLGEIKVRKFATNFFNRSSSVADVVPESFATLFTDQKSGGRHLDAGRMFGGPEGGFSVIEKCRNPRFAWTTKDVKCSLTGTCERRNNNQVKGSEGATTGGATRQDLPKGPGLLDTCGCESSIVQRMILSTLTFSAEKAVIVAGPLGLRVVKTFGVTDEMHLPGLIGKEDAKPGGRQRPVGKAVSKHRPSGK
jgi:hypothetical protein